MLRDLSALGKVIPLQTKTSIAFAPKYDTTPYDVRTAIENNLHRVNGNAFYVNLRTKKGFNYGKKTNRRWKKAV